MRSVAPNCSHMSSFVLSVVVMLQKYFLWIVASPFVISLQNTHLSSYQYCIQLFLTCIEWLDDSLAHWVAIITVVLVVIKQGEWLDDREFVACLPLDDIGWSQLFLLLLLLIQWWIPLLHKLVQPLFKI